MRSRELMLLSVVVVALLSCVDAFDVLAYTNRTRLNDFVEMYWRIDGEVAYFGVVVQNSGWFGFGFSEPTSGSMPGSDIALFQKDSSGNYYVEDRYADAFDTPPMDESCQDWTLLSAEQNSYGVTAFEFARNLQTTDGQDRSITEGEMKIVWAYGTSDTIFYHQANRGSLFVVLIKPSAPSLPDASTYPDIEFYDFKFGPITIPPRQTTYICQSFQVPNVTVDHHIIQFDALIDPGTYEYMHHYLVHVCEDVPGGFVRRFKEPGYCIPPEGNPTTGCEGLITGYARGVNKQFIPLEAGYRMGPSKYGVKYFVVEMHYNNPDALSGLVDQSGFRIWYTPHIRQYDAGVLTIGDPIIGFDDISPQQPAVHYEAECPSVCTQRMAGPVKLFMSQLHMHMAGSMSWVTHWRDGQQIGRYLDRIEYYDFNFQTNVAIDVDLLPGDRLNLHCVYNTMDRTEPTKFGVSTMAEMCMNFINYYPKQYTALGEQFAYCGYVKTGIKENATICGSAVGTGNDGEYIIDYRNPTQRDPVGGEIKSFGLAVSTTCSAPPGAPGFSTAGIVAVTVGGVLILLVVTLGIAVYVYRKRSTKKYSEIPDADEATNDKPFIN